MFFRALPAELLAENLLVRRAIIAQPGDPDFAHNNGEAGNNMPSTDQSETIEAAIKRLGELDEIFCGNAPFALEMALKAIVALTHHEGVEPLSDSEHERLLSSIYHGLGNAISLLSSRIPIEWLRDGLLSAAEIVGNLHSGDVDNDRHRDAVSRAKTLSYYAKICQYEDEIENRRRERELAAVRKMLVPATEPAPLFD